MLSEALTAELFRTFLVFARLGAALMIVPGFGERYILTRQRLLLALLFSALVAPLVASGVPTPPGEPGRIAALVGGEILIGLFLGAVTRFAMAVMHVAGTVVAYQSGLSAAALFDPNEGTMGTLPGNFFATTALVLMFAGDLHHLLLQALAASYTRLPITGGLATEDALSLLVRLADGSFRTGVELAAPLVITALLANLVLGLVSRLLPALQLLTVMLPLQLLLALVLLLFMVATATAGFGRFLETSLAFLDTGV